VERRDFVTGTVTLAAAFAAWRVRGAANGEQNAAVDSSVLLVDRHLIGSESLTADARVRGLHVLEFSGDLAGLWMREIEPRLRAGPVAIEGYTSAPTHFCFDCLARDYGARTVRRAELGVAVSFVISQRPGRRAALAPAAVRAQWSDSYA
jgi:hypothetical protein